MEKITDDLSQQQAEQASTSKALIFTLEMEKNFKLFSYRIISADAFKATIDILISQYTEDGK